jgi:hypothetical protein
MMFYELSNFIQIQCIRKGYRLLGTSDRCLFVLYVSVRSIFFFVYRNCL